MLVRWLVLCALLASGCGQFRTWFPGGGVRRVEDVAYVADGHPRHELDLFLPPSRAFPTVVFAHGGYWKGGDRRYYRPIVGLYSNIGIALAKRGIAGAIISYRLVPEVQVSEQARDVSAAFAFVQRTIGSHGGDPQALFLAGHSAGGHLAALVSAKGPLDAEARAALRGTIALSPILDLAAMKADNDQRFFHDVIVPAFGSDPLALGELSPRKYLAASSPPLLVAIGASDYTYLRRQVPVVVNEARDRGAQAEWIEIPGYEHEDMVLRMGEGDDPLVERLAAFVHANAGNR